MKKIVKLILTMCFAAALNTNGFAQFAADASQTGVLVGGIHTYTVTDNAGSEWTWAVVDKDEKAVVAADDTYTIVDDTKSSERVIKWNGAGIYYIKVVETITATGCNNDFVVEVNVIGDSYTVAFVTAADDANKVYCADDAALKSPEITLDVKLGVDKPDDTYYDMTVYYTLDDGAEKSITLTNTDKFNLEDISSADPVIPTKTSVKVTLLRVVDSNGVIFSPADADKDFTITIHPIPAKPTVTF